MALATCPNCTRTQPGALWRAMSPRPEGLFLLPIVFAVFPMAFIRGGPGPRLVAAAITYFLGVLVYVAVTLRQARTAAARIREEAPNRFEALLARLRATGVEVEPPPAWVAGLGALPLELREFLTLTAGFRWGAHVSGQVSLFAPGEARKGALLRAGPGPSLWLQPAGDACRVWWLGQHEATCVLLANSLREYVERIAALAEKQTSNDDGEALLTTTHTLRGVPPAEFLLTADPAHHAFLKALPKHGLVFDFRGAAAGTTLEQDSEDVIVRHDGSLVGLVPNRFSTSLATLTARDVEELQLCPPATADQLAALRSQLGADLPAALTEFLTLTTGFVGSDAGSRLAVELATPSLTTHPRNGRRLLRIADFDEAGALAVELVGDACPVWWVDSAGTTAVLVAQSLHEYVDRFNETLEYESALPEFSPPSLEHEEDDAGEDAEEATFASLVARLRDLEFDDADEGDERIVIHPPADDAFKAALAKRLGAPLVPELEEFLSVTRGLAFGGTVDHLEFTEYEGRDFDRMVPIYDYGNGDHAFLEQHDGECRIWWFGHDPFDCMLVARSLRELFTKIVVNAEAAAAGEDEPESTFSPEAELEAAGAPAELLASAEDEATRTFLRALPPDARVFDVEGHELPVELVGAHSYLARHGELIAFR